MGPLLLIAALALQPPTSKAPGFARLSAQATEARTAGRLDDAVALYRRALVVNPKWDEGWFFLGSIHYEQDRAGECVSAFRRFTALKPKVSAGHAFLGLCLFQSKDYAGALNSLLEARRIGLPKGDQITDVATYHAILLFTKAGNFERALGALQVFAHRPQVDPKIIEAAGIAALRRAILPSELALDDRELVYRLGRTVMLVIERRPSEAAAMFDELLRDYPKAANLHYAYAGFLIGGDTDKAIAMLHKELSIQPGHLPSLVLLSLEYLKRGEATAARPFAEQAVQSGPENFTAHVVLGRALLALDDVPGAIRELEIAVKLEPTSPQTRIALASAYQRAGNQQAAARHRAEFQRLKQMIDEQEGR